MIRTSHFLNELIFRHFPKKAFLSDATSTVNKTVGSAKEAFPVCETTHGIPFTLESIQFAGRLALEEHPSLIPLFNDLFPLVSQGQQIEKLIRWNTKLQGSGINQQNKRTLSSLISELRRLQHCLRYQSDQQLLDSMAESDNDRNLVRLRVEQIRIAKHIRARKQLENGIPCIVTSQFLKSERQNNALAESFTHTLALQLKALGIRVIPKEEREEQPQTLLVIPAKRHFCLTYAENRSAVEQLIGVLYTSRVIPLWLDLSEGNTPICLSACKKNENILACTRLSYQQMLQEIFQYCHNTASIDPSINGSRLSDRQVYQSCTPRLDELTTDLYFDSFDPGYDVGSWDFIKRFPQVRYSAPLIHPELIKRNNQSDPSLSLESRLTLTQFYRKIIAREIDDKSRNFLFLKDSGPAYKTMSILGRLALYATFSNRRWIKKSELEKILTKEEADDLESLIRWKRIVQFSEEREEFSFSYLVSQEYFSAHAIAEIFIEADKAPEPFTHACQTLRELIPNPQYEFIWRFASGHLIHQQQALNKFIQQLYLFIEDKLYLKNLLANCLVECDVPDYLSNYVRIVSESNQIEGVITSWLLVDAKELLVKEPKLWLTVLSMHAKILIEKSNVNHFHFPYFGHVNFEWPQEQLVSILESLAGGYPKIMLPLLEKTLSSHASSDLRSALVKTLGRLALAHPTLSDLIVRTIYYDPSDRVKAAAVEALAYVSAKYPDRGMHLLQQLALISDHPSVVRRAAIQGLKDLHPSLYASVFATLKQIIMDEPLNEMKIEAIETLSLKDTKTKEESCAILEKIIANETADHKLKQAALLKIYPEVNETGKAISILRDLCNLGSLHDLKLEDFIFDELNKHAHTEPLRVIQALQIIYSHANNSGIFHKVADSLALLARSFPHEVLALYQQLKSDLTFSSFKKEFVDLILLRVGENSPELVFPSLVECAFQGNKSMLWSAIEGMGSFGHVHPNLAFETLEMLLAKNEDSYIIKKIAAALGKLGIDHPLKALELLKPLLGHEDLDVSVAVSHALSLINNEHPQIVQSNWKNGIHQIIKERAANYIKNLEAQPYHMDPSERIFVEMFASSIADLLILNPLAASELIVDMAKSLSGREKNQSELFGMINGTRSALRILLQDFHRSDFAFADSLLLAIGEVDTELQKELKKSIASTHSCFSMGSNSSLPMRIKLSNTLPNDSVLKQRMEIFGNRPHLE